MNSEEIKVKMYKLREEQNRWDVEVENIEFEISDRRVEVEDIEIEIVTLENKLENIKKEKQNYTDEITKLENKYIEQRLQEIDNELTDDEFKDAFIRASYFSEKIKSSKLNNIEILENEIHALDGYKGIIVECTIPDELQNTFIPWDTRENFEDKTTTKLELFKGFKNVFEDKSNQIIKLNIDNMITKLEKDTYLKKLGEKKEKVTILEYEGKKVGFNKRHLDMVEKSFAGLDITIYYPKSSEKPLHIIANRIHAVVFPVRINELEVYKS